MGAIISVTNSPGTYEAPRADVRVDRRHPDCRAQVDRVSVPGSRTFDRNLRWTDRGDLCRSWHLARPQANRKAPDNCCEGDPCPCRGTLRPGREKTRVSPYHPPRDRREALCEREHGQDPFQPCFRQTWG